MIEEDIRKCLSLYTCKDMEDIIMGYLFEQCFHCKKMFNENGGHTYFYYYDKLICFSCLDKEWLGERFK